MIRAKIFSDGSLEGLTPEDDRALEEMFPDGVVRLNSDNCPELAEKIEQLSEFLLVKNKGIYDALAAFD